MRGQSDHDLGYITISYENRKEKEDKGRTSSAAVLMFESRITEVKQGFNWPWSLPREYLT